MVAMLLPLLAAGIGGSQLMEWLGDQRAERQGERIGGVLDQLGPDAGPDKTAAALAREGLLDTDAGRSLMQTGFGDFESARDYREQLGAIGASGSQTRANQDHAFGIWQQQQEQLKQFDEAARKQQDEFNSQILTDYGQNDFADPATRAAAADLARRDKVTKFAQANGIPLTTPEADLAGRERRATQVDDVQAFDRGIANATFLRDNVSGLARMPQGFWSSDAGKAMGTRLKMSATELLFNWKRQVYGDAEPNPDIFARLQEAFGSPTAWNEDRDKTVRLSELMRREMETARDQKAARAAYVEGRMPYDEFIRYPSTLPASEWAAVLGGDAKPDAADVPEGVDPADFKSGGKRSGQSGVQ